MSGGSSIKARFSRAARYYREAVDVQDLVNKKVCKILEKLKVIKDFRVRDILEIGCGTGLLTYRMVNMFPEVYITAIDIAPTMIDICRCLFKENPYVNLICIDFLEFKPDRKFDLICSTSALHWVRPLTAAVVRVKELCYAGTFFVGSIMIKGTLCELKTLKEEIIGKRLDDNLPDKEDFLNTLKKNNFYLVFFETEDIQIKALDCVQLIRRLHNQGVTALTDNKFNRLLTRKELEKLYSLYNKRYRDEEGNIFATYKVLYFSAKCEG